MSTAKQIIVEDAGRLELVSEIVAAFVSNNSLPAADLPSLIASVHNSFRQILAPPEIAPIPEPKHPAVPIKKSVTDEFIICLEDGKQFRSLKRHLGSVYGMTPDQYRARWNLPKDYPMVAPAYSATRSQLAKKIGLGNKPAPAVSTPAKAPNSDQPQSGGRGRQKKAA